MRAGIVYDAVARAVRGVDLIDQVAFVVGLEALHLAAVRAGIFGEARLQIFQGIVAVHARLADAEHVQVRPVHQQDLLHVAHLSLLPAPRPTPA